ncbi:hypothetical protein Hanom_Chr15g01384981 [Helianthus anomalus]
MHLIAGPLSIHLDASGTPFLDLNPYPWTKTSVAEKVDQTSAVCKKKTVCFLISANC